MSGYWFPTIVLWVLLAALLVKGEINKECAEHGKLIGKQMSWNLFGGCEEKRP